MDRQAAASSPYSNRSNHTSLRRAEIVAALSLATDLGSGRMAAGREVAHILEAT